MGAVDDARPAQLGRPARRRRGRRRRAPALVLVRARQQHRSKQARGLRALEESMRQVADDVLKRLRDGG